MGDTGCLRGVFERTGGREAAVDAALRRLRHGEDT
jgi:hypothetical protein